MELKLFHSLELIKLKSIKKPPLLGHISDVNIIRVPNSQFVLKIRVGKEPPSPLLATNLLLHHWLDKIAIYLIVFYKFK